MAKRLATKGCKLALVDLDQASVDLSVTRIQHILSEAKAVADKKKFAVAKKMSATKAAVWSVAVLLGGGGLLLAHHAAGKR